MILARRYEGLRQKDLHVALLSLREQMAGESGPYKRRAACMTFAAWVSQGGKRVRGMPRTEISWPSIRREASEAVSAQRDSTPGRGEASREEGGATAPLPPLDDEVWPLQLVDLADEEHVHVLFALLRRVAPLIEYLLHAVIFPETMEYHRLKLTASGQELGGALLFPLRLGFSGTPSDLLPRELAPCHFAPGVQAEILATLTDPAVVSPTVLEQHWSVDSILERIATAVPPLHALIDTGGELLASQTHVRTCAHPFLGAETLHRRAWSPGPRSAHYRLLKRGRRAATARVGVAAV